MELYIVVAMFFYVGNGVSDLLTSNGEQRKPVTTCVGLISFIIHVALFAWGAAILN